MKKLVLLLALICALLLVVDGQVSLPSSSDGAVAWGGIIGTLSSQTDLNTALGLKAPLASPVFTTNVKATDGLSSAASELITMQSGFAGNGAKKSFVWRDSGAIVGQIDLSFDGTSTNMAIGHFYNGGYQTSDNGLTINAISGVTIKQTYPFASLPAVPVAASMVYCINCTTAATCAAGGSGHMAVSNGAAWTCQ